MDTTSVAPSALRHVVRQLVNEQFIDEHRSCKPDEYVMIHRVPGSVNCTSEARLRFQATHDTLTQLVNRRDLYLRAEALQRRTARTGEHVGVLYIDIDGFKVVNDTFGHYVGDVILRAAAQRLAAAGRKDDVVARVGGDEFVILLSTLHSVDDAVAMANGIVESFRDPFTADGESITLGVSVGVALALADETADDTLRRADAALYQAKVRGRGQAVRWSSDFT